MTMIEKKLLEIAALDTLCLVTKPQQVETPAWKKRSKLTYSSNLDEPFVRDSGIETVASEGQRLDTMARMPSPDVQLQGVDEIVVQPLFKPELADGDIDLILPTWPKDVESGYESGISEELNCRKVCSAPWIISGAIIGTRYEVEELEQEYVDLVRAINMQGRIELRSQAQSLRDILCPIKSKFMTDRGKLTHFLPLTVVDALEQLAFSLPLPAFQVFLDGPVTTYKYVCKGTPNQVATPPASHSDKTKNKEDEEDNPPEEELHARFSKLLRSSPASKEKGCIESPLLEASKAKPELDPILLLYHAVNAANINSFAGIGLDNSEDDEKPCAPSDGMMNAVKPGACAKEISGQEPSEEQEGRV